MRKYQKENTGKETLKETLKETARNTSIHWNLLSSTKHRNKILQLKDMFTLNQILKDKYKYNSKLFREQNMSFKYRHEDNNTRNTAWRFVRQGTKTTARSRALV